MAWRWPWPRNAGNGGARPEGKSAGGAGGLVALHAQGEPRWTRRDYGALSREGYVESWTEIATMFGMIEPLSARSVFGAGQALETVTHRVTIRHRSGVESGMRLRKQDRIFEIVTVHDPDDSGRYLMCRVKEKGA